jgi:hypothetical protein
VRKTSDCSFSVSTIRIDVVQVYAGMVQFAVQFEVKHVEEALCPFSVYQQAALRLAAKELALKPHSTCR